MNDEILTHEQKIRILELAIGIGGSEYDKAYKAMVDLITGEGAKE